MNIWYSILRAGDQLEKAQFWAKLPPFIIFGVIAHGMGPSGDQN